jgi:hypothetical protein
MNKLKKSKKILILSMFTLIISCSTKSIPVTDTTPVPSPLRVDKSVERKNELKRELIVLNENLIQVNKFLTEKTAPQVTPASSN